VCGTAGLCVPPESAAKHAGPQTTAEHAVVALHPHSADQRSCSEAAEMGQATRRELRELALGLRRAQARPAAVSDRSSSRWRRGGAAVRETQGRRFRSALGALELLSRCPRAVTASMLRRSLPFSPTLCGVNFFGNQILKRKVKRRASDPRRGRESIKRMEGEGRTRNHVVQV
jgi:hypothetical protein